MVRLVESEAMGFGVTAWVAAYVGAHHVTRLFGVSAAVIELSADELQRPVLPQPARVDGLP